MSIEALICTGHDGRDISKSIRIKISIEALICTGRDGRDISISIRRTQGFEILVLKFMLMSRPSLLAHKLLMHFCYKTFWDFLWRCNRKLVRRSSLKRKLQLVAAYFSKQILKAENEKLCEPRTGSWNEHPSTSQFNKDTCQTSIGNLMLIEKICIRFGTSAVRRLKRPTWFILSKYVLINNVFLAPFTVKKKQLLDT